MRVIATVPSIEDESAGPSYTVPALCGALQRAGVEVELHTLEKLPKREWTYPAVQYKRHSFYPLWKLGWSPDMLKAFRELARSADIFHVNGVWQFPDLYPTQASRGRHSKVVYCPRGGLSKVALSRGKLKKWVMWHFGGQGRALEETSMFHAASLKEKDEIRALGFKQPIAVIPNGIDDPQIEHKRFGSSNRKLVFFGRIHPTKAADHLVKAWGNVADLFPDWSLEIAGPDCGAVAGLKSIIKERNIPRVKFVGEYSGKDKYMFLSSADLYVLPSLTENFGITVAEALICGTPAIASRGCPWGGLVDKSCGWWIDVGVESLTATLKSVLRLSPEELERYGQRGRDWMKSDYTWTPVGEMMKSAYGWLLRGGVKPNFVYTI